MHVAGSGRTDAGVHALAQVAAFSIENPIPLPNLRKAMNRLLPASIRVHFGRGSRARFSSAFPGAWRKPTNTGSCGRKSVRLRNGATCIIIPIRWILTACWLARHCSKASMISRLSRRRMTGMTKAGRKVRTIFRSRLDARGGPPDLPRARQRLSEAHGAQHRGIAAGSGSRQSGRVRFGCALSPAAGAKRVLLRRPRGCFWSAWNIRCGRLPGTTFVRVRRTKLQAGESVAHLPRVGPDGPGLFGVQGDVVKPFRAVWRRAAPRRRQSAGHSLTEFPVSARSG